MKAFASIFVLLLAVGVTAGGLWRGTWAVGGSDSSCYALMAASFASGELQPTTALREAPWPGASTTFAPGGFIPSPIRAFAASPVCAPGLSLLLAPLYASAGRDAIFLLVPVAGGLLIWVTFALGRSLSGQLAGAAAATLVATTPVFVFQVVQPMNDVVVALLWTAVFAVAAHPKPSSVWLGALTGVAILVRPNLALAAVAVAMWCARGGFRSALAFGVAAAPFVSLALMLNVALYGHPLRSGYGSSDALFSVSHVLPNVRNYATALFETQLGFPTLGLLAIAFAPREKRGIVLLIFGVTAAVAIVYLLYRPFPEWWYLRFFLPVLPAMTVLATARLVRWVPQASIAIAAVALVIGYSATSAEMAEAFGLQRLERRFRSLGEVALERLPENAVFFAVWDSGSLRYHGEREVVVWDSLDPAWLDRAIAWLELRGLEPYIAVEEWEEPLFRERFASHSEIGALDWPPRFQIEHRVRIFRPADRSGYYAGDHIPTEFVISRPRR